MKKLQIYILIGAMSLALLGIIWLQVKHVQKALMVYEENFDMVVNNTLDRVASLLAQEPDQREFIRVAREVNVAPVDPVAPLAPGVNEPWTIDMPIDESPVMLPQARVSIRDSVSFVSERETLVPIDSVPLGRANVSFLYAAEKLQHPDSLPTSSITANMSGDPQLMSLLQTEGNDIPGAVYVPWMSDSTRIDSMLRQFLGQSGIEQPFQFQIQGLYHAVVADNTPNAYQVPIYDQTQKSSGTLQVVFPEKKLLSWQTLIREAGLSVILILVIMGCFGMAIRTILRQKKLSDMKNDFINNMTHELKTPIATISLAADAIRNPRVQTSEGGIDRYTEIIKAENDRMHRQVERVLLAAQQNRGEVKLEFVSVDVHELIRKAATHIRLQVEQREGQLEIDLGAKVHQLTADPMHLTNVIYNLLENANKYSPSSPMITVQTRNTHQHLYISVTDTGKGISKADQARIFQQFYRVSTGNLHDVKGFGLGLSYVKDIVEAHGGSIQVQSILGKGSTFEVCLPVSSQLS